MARDFNFEDVENQARQDWEMQPYATNESGHKMYILGMFPYPSGQLHIGHLRNYTITDVLARFKRAQGFKVLHPIGWDAFGLPAENAAKSLHVNPADWIRSNITSMASELKSIGISYDWERELSTCDPSYYKHEQEFFIQLLKDGIAYKKLAIVNWDPVDNTVLANEQVIDGRGWRSGALVEPRELTQWFLRISDYSEDLLAKLDELELWPSTVTNMQREWIGKSQGCELNLDVVEGHFESITIFTTKPETIFGASFCAVSINHDLSVKLSKDNARVRDFIDNAARQSRDSDDEIIFTGLFVLNPFNNEKLPVYIANYILASYATGAVFGCPAHDERDMKLAKKFSLPVRKVIQTDCDYNYSSQDLVINSGFLSGMKAVEANKTIIEEITLLGIGRSVTKYKLRDWGISRQRYWGCPIPVIYCDSCGMLPANDLPVNLPPDADFSVQGNPLDHHPSWKHTTCYKCGGKATRETDTLDTFVESSWYFVAFYSPNRGTDGTGGYLPVDYYVGGIEHAILHLLYARYFTRLLNKYGYVDVVEPFKHLVTQGMVCHKTYKTQDGTWLTPEEAAGREDVIVGPSVKMSKSKKNIVLPSSVIKKYGADSARLFIISDSPIDKQIEWSNTGLEGALRFLRRLWDFMSLECQQVDISPVYDIERRTHILIYSVTEALEDMRYNVCIAKIREFCNFLFDINVVRDKSQLDEFLYARKIVLQLLAPFTPHITQVLWSILGYEGLVSAASWPIYDPNLVVAGTADIAVQICGSTRAVIVVPIDSDENFVHSKALLSEKIVKRIDGKPIKRVIFVKNRAINFVI